MSEQLPVVGIVGGTGPQGRGLARRLSHGGVEVVLGSRSADRALDSAQGLGDGVRGGTNEDCVRAAGVVIVAVPWDGHRDTLVALADELAGKVVVDCVNPLAFDKQGAYPVRVPEGSAAQQAQALAPRRHRRCRLPPPLGRDAARRVGAVRRLRCAGPGRRPGGDRPGAGARGADRRLPGIFAGRLRNAGQVEALTANLIAVNRRYKVHAGLRVTDV
jgi:predicted dinucleotide-binding enzyme